MALVASSLESCVVNQGTAQMDTRTAAVGRSCEHTFAESPSEAVYGRKVAVARSHASSLPLGIFCAQTVMSTLRLTCHRILMQWSAEHALSNAGHRNVMWMTSPTAAMAKGDRGLVPTPCCPPLPDGRRTTIRLSPARSVRFTTSPPSSVISTQRPLRTVPGALMSGAPPDASAALIIAPASTCRDMGGGGRYHWHRRVDTLAAARLTGCSRTLAAPMGRPRQLGEEMPGGRKLVGVMGYGIGNETRGPVLSRRSAK